MPLSLPQARIFFESEETGQLRDCQILVLGGRTPNPSWLRSAAGRKTVWAADHGVDACMAAGVTPHHVLGDFDSISEEGEAWLERLGAAAAAERFPAEKDYTDFQLCLNRIKGDVLVTGCWGGRFDHAFANVFSALWGLERGANILAFADESEVLIPLVAGRLAAGERGSSIELRLLSKAYAVSLLPMCGLCEGVDIRGTKWELSGAALAQGRPYAVSNVPEKETLSVSIKKGIIGVYCFFGGGLADGAG